MAVPAWHIGYAVALLELDSEDDVFQDLVEGVANVEGAVGVGRPVVEEEGVGVRPVRQLPVVEGGCAALEVVILEMWCWAWSETEWC